MKTHKSKIDFALIYTPLLLFVGMTIFMLVNEESLKAILTTSAILLATALFILYLAYSTEYVFENEILKIKCGFLYCRSIKVSRIKSVSKTNNLIASPAASLDRIEIKYDEYGVLAISPKNKDAFVKNLLEVNPNIIDQIRK